VEAVVEVRSENTQQVPFVEYDDVVQAFSSNRAQKPISVRILPGRLCSTDDLLHPHVSDTLPKLVAIDTVTVTDQKSRRCIFGKCLADLLSCPLGRRMRGDVEVDHMSLMMTKKDEGELYTESG